MSEDRVVVASAPAAIAVAGATTDIGGKGGTLTLAIEGPDPERAGGLRAYARVAAPAGLPTSGSPSRGPGSVTTVRVERMDDATGVGVEQGGEGAADSLYGAGRLLEVAGYGDVPGLEITLRTSIPPRLGLGGAASELAALLVALDALFGRNRPPEEMAETVQRATLRTGQAHGYQKPYGAVYGGVRYYSFSRKFTGLWGRGSGGIYDEPYATVSEPRGAQWDALRASILVAVPDQVNLVSGEINAAIAQRYRDEEESGSGAHATVEAMDRRAFVALLAHQRLVNGDAQGLWTLVDADTRVMEEWGLVNDGHRRIMTVAREQGAYAAKPSSTGGAVIIYCPQSKEQAILRAIREVTIGVYSAKIARGAQQEPRWPFA